MKKITNFFSKNKIYFFNILIVLTIFFISLLIKNIYPFGKFSFTLSDVSVQYEPMLYNFIEKLRTGLLENYSFNNGFGNPTTFNFVYYLSSPLNFLCVLINKPQSMFFFSILLRIIIASITTTFYIKTKTKNNFISTIGTIGYIFSGWFLTYYNFNIWLDIFMIFPLFQYSLEKLMTEEKCKLYIILIAFMIISNFYIAFMICLYTLVYFIFNTIIKKDKIKNKIRSFEIITLSTIIASLLCFGHLYIIYDSFMKTNIIKMNDSMRTVTTIKHFLSSLFYGHSMFITGNTGESAPNICVNMIFIISFLQYFLNNKITLKDKIKTLIVTTFFIFISFSATADYIINAFHVPIGFPYRYSFILSFWIIFITFKNLETFEKKISKKIYFITSLLIISLIILYKKEILSDFLFFKNLGFILAYIIFFIFYNPKIKSYKYILLLIMILESTITFSTIIPQISPTSITTNEFKITKYREKTNNDNHLNQNLYKNTNNLSLFSSMNYKRLTTQLLWFDIGSDNANHAIVYDTGNAFNMFFNIKTDNPYYLEKIFAVNKNFKKIKINNNIVMMNEMIEKSTNYKNTLELIDYNVDNKKTIINIEEDSYYRINPNIDCFIAIKKDKKILRYSYKEYYYPSETIFLEEGSQIIITDFKNNKEAPILLYKENEEVVKKAYETLNKNQIKYTHYSDSHMEGTITVDKDQVIFTSIPYDKDWEITIDGKKVQQTKILGEFMGIDCEEGTHTISLKYKTHYEIPILISIGTAASMIIHEIIKRKKQKDTKLA